MHRRSQKIAVAICNLLMCVGVQNSLNAGESTSDLADKGYQLLLSKPYVPSAFHTDDLDAVWQVWPEPLRSRAEDSTPLERRQMAFERYGMTPRAAGDYSKASQFVIDKRGNWVANCFTCHGGSVNGQPYLGSPNTDYALQTLTEEMRAIKLKLKRKLAPIDYGSLFMPLGSTRGTTNAVIFGVALAHYRDNDLNVINKSVPPRMLHHDMDAPPWWHFSKKRMLYADGFAQKGHRGLLQMAMDKSNGPEKFRAWEDDAKAIFAYLETIKPPKYPFAVDEAKAVLGRRVFMDHCAECHGAYGGEEDTYPGVVVPLDEIGTDPVRFKSLTPEHRASYGRNWFSQYGKEEVVASPSGYQAPPLDGIWASAPYFHNGSVPTLWHVLNSAERPKVWRRVAEKGYDTDLVGQTVESLTRVPEGLHISEKRTFFDTSGFGKSASGHTYPDALSDVERHQVLEYLKTL